MADPYAELRDYLSKIDAPTDAMEHITKVLGWHPPPIWEAPRAEAEAVNQAIEAPEGMRHIGWYCEHPLSSNPRWERLTKHRKRANNKRGWKYEKNTSKSLSFGDYDMDLGCPQRIPIYVKVAQS
jgi:hypothetical protein